jgi:hypothetical protein
VGSAAPSQTVQKEDLAKRILRVGKKRSLGDEEEEIDHHVEEDEEETGRTGIAPKEKKPAPQDEVIDTGKRKLGKKERKRLLEQQQQSASVEAKEGGGDSSNSPQEGVPEGEVTTDKNEEATTKTNKKKRRKVRSRQKNIFKDTRSSEEKPDYLVPGGRAAYQGRPMTEGTRDKLNLPKSKARELFVVDRSPVESNDDAGIKLAVDDLLDEKKKSSKPKKKKSKKKYKNL